MPALITIPQSPPEEPAPATRETKDTVNLLLVDDEPRNLDVLESILESPVLRLHRARSGEETLLALVQRDFAAIVLDVRMPDMDGFELARLIKQRKRNQHIPIIFLTAYFREEKDILSGYGTGAVDFLTKPVDPQILKSKVHVFVELFRSTRALAEANRALEHEIAERRQAEMGLARLAAIVESSSDAIYSRTLEGSITSWNAGAERLFGYAAEEMLGGKEDLLIPADRVEELEHRIRELLQNRVCDSWESVRLRKDGHPIDVSLTVSAIKDAQGGVAGISKIARDITGRKQAEKALRESEARLQAIMDNSPAMIFLKDAEGRYLHCNREFLRAFHRQRQDAVGKTDFELFSPSQAGVFRANDAAVLESKSPIVYEELALQADGPHTRIVTKFPLFDAEKKIYAVGGIATDVTEQRRLEAEILQVSERERRRIAQDLHDGVGQQLAGISCLSKALERKLADGGSPAAETASRISKLLDSALVQTRSLAHGLHPVAEEPGGLMAALEDLAASVSALFKVSCRFECPGPVLVEDTVSATHLHRIAQEAVSNALKHGRAQNIEIRLSSDRDGLSLLVRDDGVGIPKEAAFSRGLGLRIMRYRAGMIGGNLQVQPAKGTGTEVVCKVRAPAQKTPASDDYEQSRSNKGKRHQANLRSR